MKEEFEDFIAKNRSAFDDKEPSPAVWRRIERDFFWAGKQSWWNAVGLWRAAAVFFMVVCGYLVVPRYATNVKTTDNLSKDFGDVEAFYIEQISEKVELIDEFKRNDGLHDFTKNFKQLEAMYFVLKEEMKSHPSQKVKDALVLNLLVRIDLLNQQLHALEESDASVVDDDSTAAESMGV